MIGFLITCHICYLPTIPVVCLQGTSEKSVAKGLGPSPTHEQLGLGLGLGFRVL
jgi:hypothetical protein